MTGRLLIAIATIIFLGGNVLSALSSPPNTVAKFPGSSLKWIHVAEAEFHLKHLNLDDYIVSVVEEEKIVTVYLKSSDAPEGSKGSGGTHIGYAVEITKEDSRVVSSNYLR